MARMKAGRFGIHPRHRRYPRLNGLVRNMIRLRKLERWFDFLCDFRGGGC